MIEQQGIEEWRYLEERAVLESAFRFRASRPLDVVQPFGCIASTLSRARCGVW
ncbi:hypothetical protein OK016_14480 [Vibrio chagasii]|nr:hypothetical protein [Vibrio chagasii]